MVMEVVHEDVEEGHMQCTNHPRKNTSPGGICAFCLQEKLGKLVSSPYPVTVFPSSSSSPSPSLRSAAAGSGAGSSTLHFRHLASSITTQSDCTRKSRLPFVSIGKKNKKMDETIVFKRGIHLSDGSKSDDHSPNRRGFWKFLHLSNQNTSKKSDKNLKTPNFTSSANGIGGETISRNKQREEFVAVDENVSPGEAAIDRKMSRSRSIGCGSRSFSGDFFERISTGFGDCTLRRVESHREGKPKMHKNGRDCIKERVKCGGIFSGFMAASSSSSHLVITSAVEENNVGGKSIGHVSNARRKGWGWAFESPMRAFGKNYAVKSDASSNNKYAAPNLAADPSLLAVSNG